MRKVYYILFLLILFISGCTSTPTYKISPKWDENKTAKIHIYRADIAFHSLNPEKPFFYIDDMYIGKLGTGHAISIDVLAGKHTITVKAPFLFMPSYEKVRIEIEAVESNEYFVRYAETFSGKYLTCPGSSAIIPTNQTSILLVNKECYLQKK